MLLIAFTFACLAPTCRADKPNIIFVLADDLGWSELGCYGNGFNETPNLDQLAKDGVRFTQAYAAAPVCSPYRAALLTGQHPARIGIFGLPASQFCQRSVHVTYEPATSFVPTWIRDRHDWKMAPHRIRISFSLT